MLCRLPSPARVSGSNKAVPGSSGVPSNKDRNARLQSNVSEKGRSHTNQQNPLGSNTLGMYIYSDTCALLVLLKTTVRYVYSDTCALLVLLKTTVRYVHKYSDTCALLVLLKTTVLKLFLTAHLTQCVCHPCVS